MLFMGIYTWERGRRNEIIKMGLEREAAIPEGSKVLGEWSALGGGRCFMLFEIPNSKEKLVEFMTWSDLMRIETVPVIETEGVIKSTRTLK